MEGASSPPNHGGDGFAVRRGKNRSVGIFGLRVHTHVEIYFAAKISVAKISVVGGGEALVGLIQELRTFWRIEAKFSRSRFCALTLALAPACIAPRCCPPPGAKFELCVCPRAG